MRIFKRVKLIGYVFLFFSVLHSEGSCVWSEEVDGFVENGHGVLRDTRTELKRPGVPFHVALGILDFIEAGTTKYGAQTLASSSHTAELLIDVCDVVNLQHPDFKKRYDIFVEQWVDSVQLPFSLFTFDRLAQVFHYRTNLFDVAEGSSYSKIIGKIIEEELPILRTVFGLVHDLELVYAGHPLADPIHEVKVQELKKFVDLATSLAGGPKAAAQKEIRAIVPSSQLKGLRVLSAMAHDYLTLGRIGDEVSIVMAIPEFTQVEQREAFLAGMIQIGELATNKNLSSFVRQKMPTIPWVKLVHLRDALEHQDEHGFSIYFENLVGGRDPSINFKKWQLELETLQKRIFEAKQMIWGDDPRVVFELWLQNELDGAPVYGVSARTPQSPSLEKPIKKIFRQTPLFKEDALLWGRGISGQIQVTYLLLKKLDAKIQALEMLIPTQADSRQSQKFLDGYKGVKDYLWRRLISGAMHLQEVETDLLIRVAQEHFDTPHIACFCLGLLTMDQAHLTPYHSNLFVHASVVAKFDFKLCLLSLTVSEQRCSSPKMCAAIYPWITPRIWTNLPGKSFIRLCFSEPQPTCMSSLMVLVLTSVWFKKHSHYRRSLPFIKD